MIPKLKNNLKFRLGGEGDPEVIPKDIPAPELKETSTDIVDELLTTELKERRLFIHDEITADSVNIITRIILKYIKDDEGLEYEERTPVLLFITSQGGDVFEGLELISVIEASPTPIFTINLSFQFSMGCVIALAGHARVASKHASFLFHEGMIAAADSTNKAIDAIDYQKVLMKKVDDYILSKTKITPEEYYANSRKEWYMFAEEAKEKGVIDFILGEDCNIYDFM